VSFGVQATAAEFTKRANGAEIDENSGYDPLHAAYIAAQNFTGLFMEEVTKFPEFDSYWGIYGPAQKEYMPSGPPTGAHDPRSEKRSRGRRRRGRGPRGR
jgi:hypothetical protein